MDREEFKKAANYLTYVAMINQRYYQTLDWRWTMVDRALKILVAVLALASTLLSVEQSPSHTWWAWTLVVSTAGMIFAVVLNIVPVGDFAKHNSDLYLRWTTFRDRSERLELNLKRTDEKVVSQYDSATLLELQSEKSQIEAHETKCHESLFERCQQDVNMTIYGVRTRAERVAQIEAEEATKKQELEKKKQELEKKRQQKAEAKKSSATAAAETSGRATQ